MDLIGLDIGTTGCKASLFDREGHLLGVARREYAVDLPRPQWAEQDALRVWRQAQEVLGEVISRAGHPEVAAIGLSVQGEAVAPVDRNGDPLRPMILGMDTRTGPQNDWLRERIGAETLFQSTGMPIHTINTLPKLMWIQRHEPDIWERAHRFMLYEDFIINKLCGSPVISRCLASRTQLYDIQAGTWSAELCDAIELRPERLSILAPSGLPAGKMSSNLARSLGLARPPLIVTGGHDQACGALGVGLTRPGLAMVSTGTAEVVEVAMDSPRLNETLYRGNISIYEHTAPDLYVAMTLNHSGGLLLRWFRDHFFKEEAQRAATEGLDAYDLMLEGASPEPSSLLLLPHFAGSGTPTFDTESKGAILGLTFGTSRMDIVKAILEGLTYELRLNLDLLKEGGVRIDELRAIGGGARSSLWLQLKADITGVTVVTPDVTEAAGWGAALLAGVAAGVFDNPAEAARKTVRLGHRYEPDLQRAEVYAQRFELYRQVYPAIRSLTHHL
jgi:xylulokinase